MIFPAFSTSLKWKVYFLLDCISVNLRKLCGNTFFEKQKSKTKLAVSSGLEIVLESKTAFCLPRWSNTVNMWPLLLSEHGQPGPMCPTMCLTGLGMPCYLVMCRLWNSFLGGGGNQANDFPSGERKTVGSLVRTVRHAFKVSIIMDTSGALIQKGN